ncbi:vacuolar protein-sorting-associated protein 36-like [Oscarella lobularis]|uniref:vacuolar protein-sorting-associated protein 36-like n=1 Tax=Oscarella lobularis TaxID=121494 RepID=UPI00331428ED
MDRLSWVNEDLLPGEKSCIQQRGVRLYDGENKTSFDSGTVRLTSHRIVWDDEDQQGRTLALAHALVQSLSESSATLTKSAKIIVHLHAPPSQRDPGPFVTSTYSYIRLSFKKGGQAEFYDRYRQETAKRLWEVPIEAESSGKPGHSQPRTSRMRAGIVGIERNIAEKKRQTDKQLSQAFQDLDALMDKAKEMVTLADRFASKLEEKKGSITEDETVAFKAYLLSIGIANPVTRETHGSGSAYHKELSKQLAQFLLKPLEECNGVMTLADVYCRFNRARGMELLAPDDVFNACKMFESLRLPIKLTKFESGVLVVQLASHSESAYIKETGRLVEERGSMTSEELARLANISIVLAKERLHLAEEKNVLCRDDSVEGLRFYPNLFLTMVSN